MLTQETSSRNFLQSRHISVLITEGVVAVTINFISYRWNLKPFNFADIPNIYDRQPKDGKIPGLHDYFVLK